MCEMKVEIFDELPSTQTYAKGRRERGEDVIIVAKAQSCGMGTKGRSFSSSEGGVYLSKLNFYEFFPAKDAFTIMANTAVAVCDTLRAFGIEGRIKWPNDVFVQDKKICGILIENVFSGGNIRSSVVGVGLNVNNELPADLCEIATTMYEVTGKNFFVEEVRARLIEELSKPKDMQSYLSYLGYMGRKVMLILGDERIPATLLSVDEQGGLWVEIQGERRRLTAGEVSIKI